MILAGLVLLFAGGEGLVKGSVALAQRMGISTLLVSLVIVGFGTSAPELLVCIKAALNGTADLAVGNVIGSNIANILLIIGVGALIKPLVCDNVTIRRDSLVVILASVFVTILTMIGFIDAMRGGVLVACLVGYLLFSYIHEKRSSLKEQAEESVRRDQVVDVIDKETTPVWSALIFTIVGLAGLVMGADWLVTGASSIARSYGVPDVVIGLTLVAFGTSLPELATAVIASIKGHADVIIGNVLGSNLFNILGILGVTAMISPLSMGGRVASTDIWLMLLSAIILFPAIMTGRTISRFEGGIFVMLYIGYIATMFFF